MKKNIICIIGLCLVLILGACGKVAKTNGESKNQLNKIKEKGKLVIGTSAAYPPYEFHKEINGKDSIVGFDIEIAKEIAKDLNVDLEIKDMQFDSLLTALTAGKIDMVASFVTPTPEREKNVDFSKIYYVANQSVVVRKNELNSYKKTNDLNKKIVGVQKGTTQEKIAKEILKSKQLKGLGKLSDVMLQLKQNKVDAVIAEEPVAEAYVRKNDDLVISDIKLDTGNSGGAIAVRKGSKEFVDTINKTLDRLIEKGLLDEYMNKSIDMINK
ncbi:amino acid ABC transporter substrate-binding protein, PAAT family [Gottschalkia purinilytica]|uniref:Amino acid ABC transporter substrate-binding protein, PAAT family n=1 Tax=Gottschalkia purinilytica TaxID=1503 RepID=A0A0L0W9I1_GOTPU|nr:transporter substrate-binding domain-containing protein [Gottschalkia purinilytica]KNF08107.1 amino acid ABC transporter substrate-binding protein, PAAT family [Gottschalkia purinilytica]